ncbi:hypothetical protein OW763_14350 [Clostridium aestuarii]|uniref:Cysteine-rich CPCC domain-containing protein n=1 Tax=Clostridium aestuarii TaxID=338193 RepID=A0ABT4D4D9_9CLOT|nr:hypothetical protein [Clostridium aestuarii]MCY6485512.1 hypothetical protein [Clostridium aestuarii]
MFDIEIKHFCPICGCYEPENQFSIGEICPCCGNEIGCDDDIEKPNINQEQYFQMIQISIDSYENGKEVPNHVKQFLENAKYSEDEAWEILRNKWIEKGCPWKYNFKGERPENWGIELAKLQLLNIGIKLDAINCVHFRQD